LAVAVAAAITLYSAARLAAFAGREERRLLRLTFLGFCLYLPEA